MLGSLGVGHGKRKNANNIFIEACLSKTVINLIGGIIFIIMGLAFVILRKQLSHRTTDFYYNLLHVQFGEKGYKVGFLIAGIFFVVFGFLTVFQILRFK